MAVVGWGLPEFAQVKQPRVFTEESNKAHDVLKRATKPTVY